MKQFLDDLLWGAVLVLILGWCAAIATAQTTTCPGVLSISASLGGCDNVYVGWQHNGPLAVQSQTLTYGDGFSPALSLSDRSYSRTGVGCGAHFAVTVVQVYTNGQSCTAYYNDNHNRPCDQCGASSQPLAAVHAATGGISAAPGAIISLYQSDFGVTQQSAGFLPLPFNLSGLTAAIAGQTMPLFYVSPTQVNCLIPTTVPTGNQQITVTRPDGSMSSTAMPLFDTIPGLFTQPGGTLAAANIERRGAVTVLTLWGTGAGITFGVPGQVDTGTAWLWLGNGHQYQATYLGPSYTSQGPMPGLDQINFVLPSAEAVGTIGAQVRVIRADGRAWNTPGVDVRFQ